MISTAWVPAKSPDCQRITRSERKEETKVLDQRDRVRSNGFETFVGILRLSRMIDSQYLYQGC